MKNVKSYWWNELRTTKLPHVMRSLTYWKDKLCRQIGRNGKEQSKRRRKGDHKYAALMPEVSKRTAVFIAA